MPSLNVCRIMKILFVYIHLRYANENWGGTYYLRYSKSKWTKGWTVYFISKKTKDNALPYDEDF